LAGCPNNALTETGESYIDEAVLVNEKAKYATAVVLELDEGDSGADVTDQFMQLSPGKNADREVTVSISGTDGNGYFALQDGKLTFSGIMPLEADVTKESPAEGGAIKEGNPTEEVVERNTIPNGEAITLLFQKGEANATLDVLGIIRRKGAEEDEERIAVSETDTFVLYGIDVIKSDYINRNDVKMTHPILDVAKVNAADMVRQSPATLSTWESATGESITELMQSLNVSASVEYKGLIFGGKVEAEFSTSSNSKETRRFAKGRGFQITKDEFLRNTSPAMLYMVLDDNFKTAVNTQPAAYILDSYGTHLIGRCYWGGSAEFNYSYTGTSLTTDQQLRAALSATYVGLTANVNATAKQQASELNSNSSFTSSSRGGNNTAFMTADQFTNGYAAWVESVKANPDLCGIPNFDDALIPIWDIVAQVNTNKADLIRAEFEHRASIRGIALTGYKYEPPATMYSYITDLDVKTTSAVNVPSGYTNLVKKDMYNPDNGNVLCANAGIWGDAAWLRIAYRKQSGNSNHDAIADLAVANTGSSSTPPTWDGWHTINVDLNKGVPGDYVWLLYRKVNSSDTEAVDFIGSYCEDGPPSGQILNGYLWVQGTGRSVDLNAGSSIGSWIRLTMHKSPFTW
jgi:hypothetical protein